LGQNIGSVQNGKHKNFERDGMKYTANLSQMRAMSAKRLLRQLGKLNEADFENIKHMFRNMA